MPRLPLFGFLPVNKFCVASTAHLTLFQLKAKFSRMYIKA